MAMNSMNSSGPVLNQYVLKRISIIEQELDKHLGSLDDLRYQIDREEAVVMQLIREQRLLEERLNLQN